MNNDDGLDGDRHMTDVDRSAHYRWLHARYNRAAMAANAYTTGPDGFTIAARLDEPARVLLANRASRLARRSTDAALRLEAAERNET